MEVELTEFMQYVLLSALGYYRNICAETIKINHYIRASFVLPSSVRIVLFVGGRWVCPCRHGRSTLESSGLLLLPEQPRSES